MPDRRQLSVRQFIRCIGALDVGTESMNSKYDAMRFAAIFRGFDGGGVTKRNEKLRKVTHEKEVKNVYIHRTKNPEPRMENRGLGIGTLM